LLWTGSDLTAYLPAAWRDGLRDAGWVEGRNLIFEERTYGDHPERIPVLAAELVARKPDVLLSGATDTAQALLRATSSIPIVFAALTDPVASGLVASFARPGGNVTGTSRTSAGSLGPKLLELLRQLMPGLVRVAVVYELRDPTFEEDWRAIHAVSESIGIEAQGVPLGVASADDVEGALGAALAARPQAVMVYVSAGTIIPGTSQPVLTAVTTFAMQHGLPAASRDTSTRPIGGVLFHGAKVVPLYRRAGSYPRGSHPARSPAR
jgi:putative ABC transport system substrate-binding protein